MIEANYFRGTGRRKKAIARVMLKKGTGKIVINTLDYDKYFTTEEERTIVLAPLQSLKLLSHYDVIALVNGGGKCGQAGAVKLGMARALKIADPSLEAQLRTDGFLTRDPRMKERKKYGLRGARKGTQYSKR